MRLVDDQIGQLSAGFVPKEIRSLYSMMGVEIPASIPPLVEPFSPGLINPASLDIRVGNDAKLLNNSGEWSTVDLSGFTRDNPCYLYPYPLERWLIASLEKFHIPQWLSPMFLLKSSTARGFLEHIHAGLADPGWKESVLTMEFVNLNSDPYPIYPGQRIGQLVFDLTLGLPSCDYSQTGRYNGDTGATQSKG